MDEPTARKYRREQNTEATRRCKYCGEVFVSRGMGPHVRNSVGNGHGEHGNTPERYDIKDCEKVGESTVSVNERVTSDTDSGKELYVCRLCGKLAKGYRGYKIHMARSEGNGRHPEDSDDLDEQMFSIIPADDDWQPLDEDDVVRAVNTVYEDDDDVIQVPVMELYKIRSHLNDPDIAKQEAAKELTSLIERFA